MLVGRAVEQARIDRFLRLSGRGDGPALLLRGEAGIGKSALLDYAVERAGELRALELRPHESERQLGFASLTSLVWQLREHLEDLSGRQRMALESALALGPPLEGDRLAVSAGTLMLLERASAARPLLLVVDDAQWLDEPSREAILFAARRLDDLPVRVLLASRDYEEGSLANVGIAELALTGLTDVAARELVQQGLTLAPVVVERVLVSADGNPLALLTFPAALSADQRSGAAPVPAQLKVGTAERAFAVQAARLPSETRRALLLVCADDSAQTRPVRRALARAGLDAAALDPARRAGLLREDTEKLSVRHPLVRAAIYNEADLAARRAAHGVLADAYEGIDPDRRAWHLGEATSGLDDSVAGALDEAATRDMRRGAFATAVPLLIRAADMTVDPALAAGRRLKAANAADLAGQESVVLSVTAKASAATDDPRLKADLALVRGRATVVRDPPGTAAALAEAAALVMASDPARASGLLVNAAMAAVEVDVDRAVELADRAVLAAHQAGTDVTLAELVRARVLHYAGRPADQTSLIVLPELEDMSQVRMTLWLLAANPLVDAAQQELVRRIIGLARDRAALGLLPDALLVSGTNSFYLGDWMACEADNDEARALASAVDRPSIVCDAWGNLARLHAFRGEAPAFGRARAAYLQLAAELSSAVTAEFVAVIDAEWDLTQGNWEGVVEKVAPMWAARTVSRARAALIEAQARTGRLVEARRNLDDLEGQVAASDTPAGRNFVLRLRGLLGKDQDESVVAFEQALLAAQELGWPLETARTELMYGERLRHERRGVDARPHLVQAVEIFDRLEAAPWAARARHEYDATGQRARRRTPDSGSRLTPQELRVALAVARGASNRDTARQLFISEKTVEMHLGSIYRKLGVRSRTQMAARLAWRSRGAS